MEFLNFDAIIQNHQKIIDFDLCSVKFSDFTWIQSKNQKNL